MDDLSFDDLIPAASIPISDGPAIPDDAMATRPVASAPVVAPTAAKNDDELSFDDLIPKKSIAERAIMRGFRDAATGIKQSARVLNQNYETEPKTPEGDDKELTDLLRKQFGEGWKSPSWWIANLAHGFSGSSPMLAGALIGGVSGGAYASPGGPASAGIAAAGGAAIGGSIGSMWQTLGPAYYRARLGDEHNKPMSHEDAVDAALKETAVAGAFGAAMGAAPVLRIPGLKGAVSNALAQIFGVQPGLGVAQRVVSEGVTGRNMPSAEELLKDYAINVVMGTGMVAGHSAIKGAYKAKPSDQPPKPKIEDVPPQAPDASQAQALNPSSGKLTPEQMQARINAIRAQAPAPDAAQHIPPDVAAAIERQSSPAPTSEPVSTPPAQKPEVVPNAVFEAIRNQQQKPEGLPPEVKSAPEPAKAPEPVDNTGQTVSEPKSTFVEQQKKLIAGESDAMFFPVDENTGKVPNKLKPPKGMSFVNVYDAKGKFAGLVHYNEAKISKDTIKEAFKTGRQNEVLKLGDKPVAEVMQDAQANNEPVVVATERTPDGTEVKAVATTPSEAPRQAANVEATKTPGNEVRVETPEQVIGDRVAKVAAETAPSPEPTIAERIGNAIMPGAQAAPIVRAPVRPAPRPAETARPVEPTRPAEAPSPAEPNVLRDQAEPAPEAPSVNEQKGFRGKDYGSIPDPKDEAARKRFIRRARTAVEELGDNAPEHYRLAVTAADKRTKGNNKENRPLKEAIDEQWQREYQLEQEGTPRQEIKKQVKGEIRKEEEKRAKEVEELTKPEDPEASVYKPKSDVTDADVEAAYEKFPELRQINDPERVREIVAVLSDQKKADARTQTDSIPYEVREETTVDPSMLTPEQRVLRDEAMRRVERGELESNQGNDCLFGYRIESSATGARPARRDPFARDRSSTREGLSGDAIENIKRMANEARAAREAEQADASKGTVKKAADLDPELVRQYEETRARLDREAAEATGHKATTIEKERQRIAQEIEHMMEMARKDAEKLSDLEKAAGAPDTFVPTPEHIRALADKLNGSTEAQFKKVWAEVAKADPFIRAAFIYAHNKHGVKHMQEGVFGRLMREISEQPFTPVRTETVASLLKETGAYYKPEAGIQSAIRKWLEKKILRLVGDMKIHVVDKDTLRQLGEPLSEGMYRSRENDIIIDRAFLDGKSNRAYALVMHEVLHGALANMLSSRKYAKFAREIRTLSEAVERKFRSSPEMQKDRSKDPYGFTNEHEFISEAMTNPEFQAILSEAKFTNAELREMGISPDPVSVGMLAKTRLKSAFDVLVDVVRKAIDLPPNSRTALEQIIRMTDTALNERTTQGLGAKFSEMSPQMKVGMDTSRIYDIPEFYASRSSEDAAAAKKAANFEKQLMARGMASEDAKAWSRELMSALGEKATMKDALPVIKQIANEYAVERGLRNELAGKGLTQEQTAGIVEAVRSEIEKGSTLEQLKPVVKDLADAFSPEPSSQDPLTLQGKGPTEQDVRATSEEVARVVDEVANNLKAELESAAKRAPRLLNLRTLTDLAQNFDQYSKSAGENPVREISNIVEGRNVTSAKIVKDSTALISEALVIGKKYKSTKEGRETWNKFTQWVNDVTIANVRPDIPLKDNTWLGKDALAGKWSKAQHAKLEKVYTDLPADLKQLYSKSLKHYADLHERQGTAHIEGVLKSIGVDDAAMAKRFYEGTPTADDALRVGADLTEAFANIPELTKIGGAYFPLSRRGEFVVRGEVPIENVPKEAKRIENNIFEFEDRDKAISFAEAQGNRPTLNKVWVDKNTGERFFKDADGKEVAVTSKDTDAVERYRVTVNNSVIEFARTRRGAERIKKSLEDAGVRTKDVTTVKFDSIEGLRGGLHPSLRALLGTLEKREGFKNMSAKQRKELQGALHEMSLRMPNAKPRRNIAGASTQFEMNLFDYTTRMASYLAKIEAAPRLDAVMKRLEARTAAVEDAGAGRGEAARRISNEVNRRMASSDGAPENYAGKEAIDRILALSAADKLGSLSYSIINSTQVGMVALPVLAGEFNPVSAAFHVTKAYKDIGTIGTAARGVADTGRALVGRGTKGDFIDTIKSRLKDPQERAMIDELLGTNSINPDSGIEVGRLIGSMDRPIVGKIDKGIGYLENVTRALPSAVEAINRTVTALAAFRLKMRRGASFEEAVRFAQDIVDNTQFNYSASNAPPAMNRAYARLVTQFMKYPQHMYQLLGNEVGRFVQGNKPGDRTKAIATIAYISVTHAAMAGALGLAWEPLKIALAIGSGMGLTMSPGDLEREVRKQMAKMFGTKGGEVVSRGLPRLIGIDLSNRIGLDNLLTFGMPDSDKSKDWWNFIGQKAAGAPGSYAADLVKSGAAAINRDGGKALELAIPFKSVADTFKAWEKYREAPKTPGGYQKQSQYTLGDVAKRVVGFTPAKEAEELERRKAISSQVQDITHERNTLMQKYSQAKTGADRAKALIAIEKFNRGRGSETQITQKDRMNAEARAKRTKSSTTGFPNTRTYREVIKGSEGVYNTER